MQADEQTGIRNRATLLLALLYAGGRSAETHPQTATAVEGITRLEKLLFLLKREKGFLARVPERDDFHFVPFRMGPWSQEVYDEVDFLESLGLLARSEHGARSAADAAHDDELFSNIVLDKWQKASVAPPGHSESFALTEQGIAKAREVWSRLSRDEQQSIIEVKKRFNNMSLKQFLRYVYKQYPEYATESEIRESLGIR